MNASNFNFLTWTIIILGLIELVSIIVLFWVHRKNNLLRFIRLEEMIHEREMLVNQSNPEQADGFKKAIHLHLTEISERIKSNEVNMNKLMNELDALRASLVEEDEIHDESKPDEQENTEIALEG